MKKETTAEAYLEKIMTGPIQEDCPVHRSLELLSGKWRTHMIYELCKRPSMRFSELKRAYPHITNTMLTNTLRDLETLGIVNREQFNEIPPHAEYSLTEKGRGLLPVFFEISKWGEHNLDALWPAETDNTGAKFPQRQRETCDDFQGREDVPFENLFGGEKRLYIKTGQASVIESK